MPSDDPFAKYANGDGTYNGAKMLAEISGLSEAEIVWTFNRMKHLTQVEGHHKAYAKGIVKAEAKSKPWIAQTGGARHGA